MGKAVKTGYEVTAEAVTVELPWSAVFGTPAIDLLEVVGPVLSALEQGFEVYVITDASGDISEEAHERAVTRMIQAGARPITALQYLLELQRDWARGDTYDLTTGIARQWGGAYGLGITYAKSMFNASEGGH